LVTARRKAKTQFGGHFVPDDILMEIGYIVDYMSKLEMIVNYLRIGDELD